MRHSISSELAQKMVDEAVVKAGAEGIGGGRVPRIPAVHTFSLIPDVAKREWVPRISPRPYAETGAVRRLAG
jgi:hypothetical protein